MLGAILFRCHQERRLLAHRRSNAAFIKLWHAREIQRHTPVSIASRNRRCMQDRAARAEKGHRRGHPARQDRLHSFKASSRSRD